MKNKKSLYCFLSLAMFILGMVSACNYFNEPPDYHATKTVDPAISGVTPAGGAMAGVRKITITGENFKTNLDSIDVYFGPQVAIIDSETITSTQLVANRPPNYGEAMEVKIIIPDRKGIAKSFNYDLEQPVEAWGNFSTIARAFYTMEFDNQDRLWISARRYIYSLTADGLYVTIFKNDKMGLGSKFDELTDMRFGAGGYLYFVLGDQKEIYRLNTTICSCENDSLPPEVYCTLPANISKMDFNDNGNIYTGKNTGLYLVDAAKNITATGLYNAFTLVDIHIYNDYVYVADATRVYRSSIQGDGSLVGQELLVDLAALPEDKYKVSTCKILSFSIDINGKIYLCLGNHLQYSVFYLEDDGMVTPFYIDNILPQGVEQLIWGNSRFLFLNRGMGDSADSLRGVYRVGMLNNGAPYLGRNLP
jgi:hypothetical protein